MRREPWRIHPSIHLCVRVRVLCVVRVSMFLSWFDKRRSELLDRHYQSLEDVDKMTGVASASGSGGGVKEEGIKQEGAH